MADLAPLDDLTDDDLHSRVVQAAFTLDLYLRAIHLRGIRGVAVRMVKDDGGRVRVVAKAGRHEWTGEGVPGWLTGSM